MPVKPQTHNHQSSISKVRINYDALKDHYAKNDPGSLVTRDRESALRDLEKGSFFQPMGDDQGPYELMLSIEENRMVIRILTHLRIGLPMLVLSLKPYSRLIKDYFMIVQSYDDAIREGKPSRIEAIDAGRRGLHNEGAELLIERLKDKIEMDFETARRLFTLICVLHAGKVHALR
jgi:uncharacterized protein (UPF0262 family)